MYRQHDYCKFLGFIQIIAATFYYCLSTLIFVGNFLQDGGIDLK
jgi:hypothetical protein